MTIASRTTTIFSAAATQNFMCGNTTVATSTCTELDQLLLNVFQVQNTKYIFRKVFEIQNTFNVIAVEDMPTYFIAL